MSSSIIVIDDFCPQIDTVRQSALASGFGTWLPSKGEVGSSVYEGMNFWGEHGHMLKAIATAVGAPIFPNSMFFRVTNEETEKAYVHSDRHSGAFTCVAYLSDHKDTVSGTGFFRHRKLGIREMPTFDEMKVEGVFDELKRDMVEGSDEQWEQLDFVRGIYNRAVIFQAPLFHSRWPKHGIGTSPENGRLVWVSHFNFSHNLP